MIWDVFDKMAGTRAEREEVASTIAPARAQAAAGDDYEDDLDSVHRMLNMRLFLKSSIRHLSDLSIHLVGFHCVQGTFVTGALQEPSYGDPYGRRHHTVHTVSHTAALKSVFRNPARKTRTLPTVSS